MHLHDYNYELPKELIAQEPSEKRDLSRLMVLHRDTQTLEHRIFRDVTEYLRAGDVLVVNESKVLPVRLYGTKLPTGAAVEAILVKQMSADVWETMVRPGRRLLPGARVAFGDGEKLKATVTEKLEGGNRLMKFEFEGNFFDILNDIGNMPLPPYITKRLEDKSRYQTVYAATPGSCAAPTAGFHFTQKLLTKIREMGVTIAPVTLHVGLGTFRPVKVDDITKHKMHSEHYEIPQSTADAINAAHASGHRVVAVGTTSCRTLEAAARDDGFVPACSGNTEIFIYPGYKFKVPDALITNFHLPESTLMMLVSAFAGHDFVMSAYRTAVAERYRFFSFGDAMLIE